jgi:hypothetical protein
MLIEAKCYYIAHSVMSLRCASQLLAFHWSSRGVTFLQPRIESSVVSLDLSSTINSNTEVPTRPFENMPQLRYLGRIIADQVYNREEIKCRGN